MKTTAECPHCHELNTVAPSTIGRYVTCEKCRCKFWVYVPPLEGVAKSSLIEPPSAAASLGGDHHHVDSPGMIRQESLLATIHDDLLSLRKQIMLACFIFVAGCAAVITTLLWR